MLLAPHEHYQQWPCSMQGSAPAWAAGAPVNATGLGYSPNSGVTNLSTKYTMAPVKM